MTESVRRLRAFSAGRPLVCSEYMARDVNSTFDPLLGHLEREGVWAINWGLVAGRSQTFFPWGSWNTPSPAQPDPWHHDVLHDSGAPYRAAEAAYLRNHTSGEPQEWGATQVAA